MNARKYLLRQFFNDLMPIYPLYLLYIESKGLTVQQISALLAIWSVSVVILEIPTGVMADRWSRRNLIRLGSLCRAACYFVWIFSDRFELFALGFILWGVGEAFISGAEEALLFDSLKQKGQQERFEVYLGKGRFLSGVGKILAAVSGGLIGTYLGMQWALLLSMTSGLISAGIASLYKEVNYYREKIREEQQKKETVREAMAFLFAKKDILLLAIMAILVISMSDVLDEYDTMIAAGYGIQVTGIGIWMALRFILAALGGYFAHQIRRAAERLFRWKSRFATIAQLSILGAVSLTVAATIRSITVIGFYGFYYLIMSVTGVLHEDYIQQRIEDEGRSTVHSMISLTHNLYSILCFGGFAYVLGMTDLQGMLLVVACYSITATLVLTICYSRLKIRSSE